jgi:hypothetical protein
MKQFSLTWPAIITFSAVAAQILFYDNLVPPLRPWVMLWFLIICPGMAFVHFFRIKDTVSELVLAIALSLAIDLLVAAAILYTGFWSPELILTVLVFLSQVGVVCQLFLWYSILVNESVEQT